MSDVALLRRPWRPRDELEIVGGCWRRPPHVESVGGDGSGGRVRMRSVAGGDGGVQADACTRWRKVVVEGRRR